MEIQIKNMYGEVLSSFVGDNITIKTVAEESAKSVHKLTNANLGGTNLEKVNLVGAILDRANFENSNLTLAKLEGADLMETTFAGANLKKAKLRRSDLSDSILRFANLENADLRGASLKYADLTCANLSGANLTGADLTGADLSGANLKNTDLSGTILEHAILEHNNIENTNFKGAILLKGSWSVKNEKEECIEEFERETNIKILKTYINKNTVISNDFEIWDEILTIAEFTVKSENVEMTLKNVEDTLGYNFEKIK